MSPSPLPNSPSPITFVPDDNDEAMLAAVQAQLDAAQTKVVAKKKCEAEEARLKAEWAREEQE